jgi:hypothetical protein
MPKRNIYEILRDENGNAVYDESGNAITVLVREEEFTDPEPEPHEEVIHEPEPTKEELLAQIKALTEKVNNLPK